MSYTKFLPIVLNEGKKSKESTSRVPLASNASMRIGSFFDPFTGTNGAQTFVANQNVRGVVVDIMIYVGNQYVSLTDYISKNGEGAAGTILNATAIQNPGYTAPSGNVGRLNPDLVVYEEINIGDKVEAYLGNSSGVVIPRNNTTGTLNNFIEPSVNHPWLLDGPGASTSNSGLCFRIVERHRNPNKVTVMLLTASGSIV
jgi:hypothetical protein